MYIYTYKYIYIFICYVCIILGVGTPITTPLTLEGYRVEVEREAFDSTSEESKKDESEGIFVIFSYC
jgi:hypothetical protein